MAEARSVSFGPLHAQSRAGRADCQARTQPPILERCAQPGGITADQVDLVGFDTVADVPAWRSTELRRPEPKRVGLSPTLKEWKSEFFEQGDPGPYRVRVREVELLPNKEPQPGKFLHSGKPEEVTERTVFTDTVLLPPL